MPPNRSILAASASSYAVLAILRLLPTMPATATGFAFAGQGADGFDALALLGQSSTAAFARVARTTLLS